MKDRVDKPAEPQEIMCDHNGRPHPWEPGESCPPTLPKLPIGTRVRVWPGTLEGRSYVATTLSSPAVLGSMEGVYVRSDTGGTDFIALTHVRANDD